MTSNPTDVPESVRAMVDRTAQRVEVASGSTAPAREAPAEAYVTLDLPGPRRHGLRAAVAVAAVAVLAVAGAVFVADSDRQDRANQAAARPEAPSLRPEDMYDQALVDITGPVALPAAEPPGLEWVFLTAVDGQQHFVAQSGDILIAICPIDRCSYAGQELLRSVEANGERFEMVQYPADKIPPLELAPLPEDYRRFWEDVELVAQRPDWLRAEHTPGGVRDPADNGG